MKNYFGILLVMSSLVSAQIDLVEDVKLEASTYVSQEGETNIKKISPVEKPNVYTIEEVKNMAVFPGCEEFDGNNEELNICLLEKLSKEIILSETAFATTSDSVYLDFVISKYGKIVKFKPIPNGNSILEKKAQNALHRISIRMINYDKRIIPAKLKDGTEVDLQMKILIRNSEN